MMCPLTVWEDMLRGGVRAESFVGRWVRYFLYYQAPEWVFTAAYVAWTASSLTLWRLPPRPFLASGLPDVRHFGASGIARLAQAPRRKIHGTGGSMRSVNPLRSSAMRVVPP